MNLFNPRFSLAILAGSLVGASPAWAQKLFTDKGQEIPFADVTMQGNSVAWRTKEISTGNDRILNIPATSIIRLDFPEPTDLQEAEMALNQGNGADAVTKAEPVIRQFSPFKLTPGSYYVPAALIKLEGLALQKSADEFEKLRTELKGINMSSSDQLRLAAAEALQDFSKGLLGPAATSLRALIPKTDDAAVLAKLYNLLGDVQMKQGNFQDALESYLSVSVFYGSQADQLPRAELGASRALSKMQRLEDSRDMLMGIKERYPTSPQAKSAREELAVVLKSLGQAEAEEAEAADKADAAAKPAETK
jgi:TolA-binding protein